MSTDADRGSNGFNLTCDDIEIVNAYGPYTHGVWENGNIKVGGDNSLGSRSELLSASIMNYLTKVYTKEQIKNLSLLDVGCYDGWLTHQISKLGFKRVIGLEARRKNIEKGKIVRKHLGIDCNVEFLEGDINNLKNIFKPEEFDVVICCGLMHHLTSTIDGISLLGSIAKSILIVNTICFPDSYMPKEMGLALELKDIPYFYNSPIFGFSGFKYESGYYDGSAATDSIVGIPSESLLKMSFNINYFSGVETVSSIKDFEGSLGSTYRRFNEITLAGKKKSKDISLQGLGQRYEIELSKCYILDDVFDLLNAIVFEKVDKSIKEEQIKKCLDSFGFDKKIRLGECFDSLKEHPDGKILSEIYKNIYFSPFDKACIEIAKVLIRKSEIESSIKLLQSLTKKLNSDWRSVYRAFYWLFVCFTLVGYDFEAKKYEDLLFKSNPNFPKIIIDQYKKNRE
jgi:hypothetical protein